VFTETDIQIIKTPGWHNNLMPLPRRRRRDALLDGRGRALTPGLGHAESGHGRGSEKIHDHGP